MIAGIVVTTVTYTHSFRLGAPLTDFKFYLSHLSAVDMKLILGVAVFGCGWGLAGACPGPMLTNMGAMRLYPSMYFLFVVLGMWFQMYVGNGLADRALTHTSLLATSGRSEKNSGNELNVSRGTVENFLEVGNSRKVLATDGYDTDMDTRAGLDRSLISSGL